MDQAAEVKSKVDIVEVISSYLPLKRAGRNFSGLCPFHSEKTPSFMVSPERQAFKCFGCGESGDVFTFLEKMEGWEFRETLEELAKKVGVKLSNFKPTAASRNKEKLIEINKLAAKFYKYLLNKHPAAEPARKYLLGRGVDESLWEKFDLGFAPSGWENLAKFLGKKGFSAADVATAGLIIGREGRGSSSPASPMTASRGGFYDRFRGRIMFPLKDSRGVILGFAGRLLSDNAREVPPHSAMQSSSGQAKYINSPETPIFNKGALLFGLDVARSAIREKNETILVEGEFDVLSSHRAGVLNVVASKGTALTEKQVATLARICERVIICFDTDLAGDAASRRGIELLDMAGVNVRVARLGKFKDPDEMAYGDPKGYVRAISDSEDVYDYFIESASGRFNPATAEGKKKIGREILPILAKISDDLVKAHYTGKLAKILDLEIQAVADAVGRQSLAQGTFERSAEVGSSKEARVLSQEEYFLALLIFQDEVVPDLLDMLSYKDFEGDSTSHFFRWLHDIIGHSRLRSRKSFGGFTQKVHLEGQAKARKLSLLLKHLPKELNSFVDSLYLVNISLEFADRELWAVEITKIAKIIRDKSLRRQQRAISSKLKEAQKISDEQQIQILSSQFDKISEARKKGLN